MYLILGKSGYIAQSFVEVCEQRKVPYFAVSRSLVDYTNPVEFRDYLQAFRNVTGKTAFVINCAGFIGKPNVDACEDVHISSGCIYNGYEKDFRETDPPNFTFNTGSFYSGSKALAEQVVIQNYPYSYIFRLRVPFDERSSPRNYITKMLSYDKLLDVRNSFSHRADFVNGCLDLIEKNAPSGIYNLTNPGSLTTREVVDMIKTYTQLGKDFSFYPDEDIFLQDVKAPRSSCVLDVSKALCHINLRDVRCAFIDSLKNYNG